MPFLHQHSTRSRHHHRVRTAADARRRRHDRQQRARDDVRTRRRPHRPGNDASHAVPGGPVSWPTAALSGGAGSRYRSVSDAAADVAADAAAANVPGTGALSDAT